MHPLKTLGLCLALVITAVAGVAPTAIAKVDVTKSTTNKDAMNSLDANTFVGDIGDSLVPENKVFLAWDLHICVQKCDSKAANDERLISGHTSPLGTTPIENITFSICNYQYRKCTQDCLVKHESKEESWPPAGTTWVVESQSKLPTCVRNCKLENAQDQQLLVVDYTGGGNPNQVLTFAYCNTRLSFCTNSCQADFNDEVKAFKRRHGSSTT